MRPERARAAAAAAAQLLAGCWDAGAAWWWQPLWGAGLPFRSCQRLPNPPPAKQTAPLAHLTDRPYECCAAQLRFSEPFPQPRTSAGHCLCAAPLFTRTRAPRSFLPRATPFAAAGAPLLARPVHAAGPWRGRQAPAEWGLGSLAAGQCCSGCVRSTRPARGRGASGCALMRPAAVSLQCCSGCGRRTRPARGARTSA